MVLFANTLFFTKVTEVYPFEGKNILFVLSLGSVLWALLVFILTLLSSKYTTKPVLIFFVIAGSLASYFMYTYQIVIDDTMIQNIFETNMKESLDLFSLELIGFLVFLGLIPAIYIYKQPLVTESTKTMMKTKLIYGFGSIIIIAFVVFIFSPFYTSFFREHKPLRFYTNPTFAIYNLGKFINKSLFTKQYSFKKLGTDIAIDNHVLQKRELIILVVGEAARADHFSLNGYTKETNPLLEKEPDILSFKKMQSCGTSTAISVPCMFSFLGDKGDDPKLANSQDDILDVLKRAGVNILWRDNNSDSKGVASRVEYQDFKTSKHNTMCEGSECRDEGMLVGLQEYIDSKKSGDILIVLHQMGNHGPAYYKRYPKEFEKFTPTCQTNQLEQCSKEEVTNAYDNAIVYTDYFLHKTIELLKQNNNFETAMVYLSDHGESLGENGVYLHGMPKLIAPDAQTHIPMIIWLGDKIRSEINQDTLAQKTNNPYTHANLVHTLIGIFEASTKIYDPKLDITKDI